MRKILNPKIVYLALTITLLLACIPQGFGPTEAQPQPEAAPQPSKIDSLLSFMRMKRSIKQASGIETLDATLFSPMVPVSIRFTEEKSLAEANLFEEETGGEFYRLDGDVLHASSIYPAQVPWASIDAIAERTDVVRIESAVKIQEPTLDVSVPEIGADRVWNTLDISGKNKTGEGVIIADLDTGVDWEHEQFWYPDGTGKVERIYDATGEYVRPNLFGASRDVDGHGTSVAHILLGGQIGGAGDVGTYVGVAPGASLFAVKVFPPDAVDDITGATWAQTRGADVIIYEFGRWSVGEFMDGSSNSELTIDELTAAGTVVVVPSGNLAGNLLGPDGRPGTDDDAPGTGSERHARTTVPGEGSRDIRFNPLGWSDIKPTWVIITILWRTPANNLVFSITTPTPEGPYELPAPVVEPALTVTADGQAILSLRDNSERGTAAFNIMILDYANPDVTPILCGDWTLTITNPSSTGEVVNLFNVDDAASWQGGTYWVDFRDDSTTITAPSTADSAISVASYATRARVTGTVGDYSFFTGMGPRIDGAQKPDIAAPGHNDVWVATSQYAPEDPGPNSYHWFGGTSAAGPHVAGTAALMLQANPALTHSDVKSTLLANARQDTFTGAVPNSIWGWGKLDAYASTEAVQPAPAIVVDGDPSDWVGIDPLIIDPDDYPYDELNVKEVYVTSDASNLYIRIDVYGAITGTGGNYMVCIDSDRDPSTGMPLHDIGMDYQLGLWVGYGFVMRIADGASFPLTYAYSGPILEMGAALSDLGYPGVIDFFVMCYPNDCAEPEEAYVIGTNVQTIIVDGDPGEWTGDPFTTDDPGDAVADGLDLTDCWICNDDNNVYVRLDTLGTMHSDARGDIWFYWDTRSYRLMDTTTGTVIEASLALSELEGATGIYPMFCLVAWVSDEAPDVGHATYPPTLPAEVSGQETLDSTGAPKTSFVLGETVLVSATVTNVGTADQLMLIVVQLKDPDLRVLAPTYIGVTLPPRLSLTPSLGFILPLTGYTSGTWTAKVMVLDTWPALGGVPIAEPVTVTFTVTS